MNALLGQIIRLTKSILLNPPEGGKRYPFAQFTTGRTSYRTPFPGIGLCWWYSPDTFPALDSISAMLVSSFTKFRDCDIETTQQVITRALEEICLDSAFFSPDAVMGRRHRTLFECASARPSVLATRILGIVVLNLEASMALRCAIYAVPRLLAPTFLLKDKDCL